MPGVQVAGGSSSLLLPPGLSVSPRPARVISPVAAQRQPGVGWLVVGQTREREDVISEVTVITEHTQTHRQHNIKLDESN